MVLPYAASMALLKSLVHTPAALQQVVFVAVLLACAAGQFVALSRLRDDKQWEPGWRALSYALKIAAFVSLMMFLSAAAIAGYYTIHPKAK